MYTVNFYKDAADEWRWTCKAENGNIVADSGEGYKNIDDARNVVIDLFGDKTRFTYEEADKPVPVTDNVGEEIPPEELPAP